MAGVQLHSTLTTTTKISLAQVVGRPIPIEGQEMREPNKIEWAQLLQSAIEEPGKISEAYRRFHGYSLGNRISALFQCAKRGITPGPLASFNRWKELGRHVKKGEKALSLCMPVTAVLIRALHRRGKH
jgi:N-terminal domain of anti-restriction factor ArdC